MDLILVAVISLGAIGLIAAVILYAASKKFAVYEDPRIAQVAEVLPQANCGGCGYPGCSGFAAACVKAGSLEGKLCPVGGQPTMEKVAGILGLEATASEPKVAVVRCNGTCANRPKLTQYDGVRSCVVANSTYGGETGCTFGCLGCGDCVSACQFDAIHMNPETGLPEVMKVNVLLVVLVVKHVRATLSKSVLKERTTVVYTYSVSIKTKVLSHVRLVPLHVSAVASV